MTDHGRGPSPPDDTLGRALLALNGIGVYTGGHAPPALDADEAMAWHRDHGRALYLSCDWRSGATGTGLVPVAVVAFDLDPATGRPELARDLAAEPPMRRLAVAAVSLAVVLASALLVVTLASLAVGAARWALG